MSTIRITNGLLTVSPDFKPGDPEPVNAGYLDWHAWAEVQRKAGIRQVFCDKCARWKCPQDMAGKICKGCA